LCVVVEGRGLARFGLGMSSWRGLPLTQRPPGHLHLLHSRGVESQISLSCGDWRATPATRLANRLLLPQIIMASPTAPTPTTSRHVPTLPWIPLPSRCASRCMRSTCAPCICSYLRARTMKLAACSIFVVWPRTRLSALSCAARCTAGSALSRPARCLTYRACPPTHHRATLYTG
jgi:hypothetical protein